MTDQTEDDPLKVLREHVASLPQAGQDKVLDDPHELFEMIERGDAVGVYIAVKNGADVEITDENSMTPLHHAAANDMPLIAEALNQEPNQAMWMKDKFDRTPQDLSSVIHDGRIERLITQKRLKAHESHSFMRAVKSNSQEL